MEQDEKDVLQQQDNTAYIAKQPYQQEAIMSQHLDATETLEKLKKMLMGYEYDTEEDEWIRSQVIVGYDKEGNEVKVNEPPLMDMRTIKVIISFLGMFMNPNTFLSRLDSERINDIMWDVNVKLFMVFNSRLKYKLSPEERVIMWGTIEYPILFALNRANKKITLDAMTKMQHSIEHIRAGPGSVEQPKPNKEFKLFG